MTFVQEDEVIEGVLPQGSVKSLDMSIRVRGMKWGRDSLDAQCVGEPAVEVAAIVIAIRSLPRVSELSKDSVVIVH